VVEWAEETWPEDLDPAKVRNKTIAAVQAFYEEAKKMYKIVEHG
jgi:hypothetical protein